MIAEKWKSLIIDAVDASNNGNGLQLDLLSKLLEECEQSKQVLRERGYGWTGLSLLKTITDLVPNYETHEP